MVNAFSLNDLLDFLDHAGDRGLMPTATATALAVASRNVFGVLSEQERTNLAAQDIAAVVKRFNNKRAKDFNPSSLKEYGRRVQRAMDLFLNWREDPANFTVKTRATSTVRRKEKASNSQGTPGSPGQATEPAPSMGPDAYQSSVPVRPGLVVTLSNIPFDLTTTEAERIASFVRMLAVDGQ